MAHKQKVHRNSSESNSGSETGAKPVPPPNPTGSSPLSPGHPESNSLPAWQAIFVISAIALGLIVLLAKAVGLF